MGLVNAEVQSALDRDNHLNAGEFKDRVTGADENVQILWPSRFSCYQISDELKQNVNTKLQHVHADCIFSHFHYLNYFFLPLQQGPY